MPGKDTSEGKLDTNEELENTKYVIVTCFQISVLTKIITYNVSKNFLHIATAQRSVEVWRSTHG